MPQVASLLASSCLFSTSTLYHVSQQNQKRRNKQMSMAIAQQVQISIQLNQNEQLNIHENTSRTKYLSEADTQS
jgi:hypothetical protein